MLTSSQGACVFRDFFVCPFSPEKQIQISLVTSEAKAAINLESVETLKVEITQHCVKTSKHRFLKICLSDKHPSSTRKESIKPVSLQAALCSDFPLTWGTYGVRRHLTHGCISTSRKHRNSNGGR